MQGTPKKASWHTKADKHSLKLQIESANSVKQTIRWFLDLLFYALKRDAVSSSCGDETYVVNHPSSNTKSDPRHLSSLGLPGAGPPEWFTSALKPRRCQILALSNRQNWETTARKQCFIYRFITGEHYRYWWTVQIQVNSTGIGEEHSTDTEQVNSTETEQVNSPTTEVVNSSGTEQMNLTSSGQVNSTGYRTC
jgi:hypothetical protein